MSDYLKKGLRKGQRTSPNGIIRAELKTKDAEDKIVK